MKSRRIFVWLGLLWVLWLADCRGAAMSPTPPTLSLTHTATPTRTPTVTPSAKPAGVPH